MKLAFLGSPEISTIALRALVEAGHEVALVVTQPDRKRGRGGALSPTPVKALANELGLPVSHRMRDLLDFELDYAVVAAFGRLIPDMLLAHVEHLNIHPSLLPRWRGAAPVDHTVLNGDRETGVCVMQLVKEMDAGPLYRVVRTDVGEEEHVGELLPRLFDLGSRALLEALAEGLGDAVPQVGEPTFAPKFEPEDTRLDWNRSASELERMVRTDRAWTTFRGKRFLVIEARALRLNHGDPGLLSVDANPVAATGEGGLELLRVKPEGKGAMEAWVWANGARLDADERLV